MQLHGSFFFCLAALSLLPLQAQARTLDDCKGERDDKARLECFDEVTGYKRDLVAPGPAAAQAPGKVPEVTDTMPLLKRADEKLPKHTLVNAWLLGEDKKTERTAITNLQVYRPVYFITTWTSDINSQPSSPAAGHTTPPGIPLDTAETKFQISFKSEVISPALFKSLVGSDRLRLWFAYTQQSQWQLYNRDLSSPFRNTDYEPELILTYNTGGTGWNPALVNFGFVHQSNGRSLPQSRSWNRVYAQGGWQVTDDLSVMARAWRRIHEDITTDDNPDITSYVGRADAVVRYDFDARNKMELLARHNLRASESRGFLQLDLATQGIGEVSGGSTWVHLQASYGYGESLIDYNFKQKRIGIGFSFGNW